MPPVAAETSLLRLRLARILLWTAFGLVLAAQPLPWGAGWEVWRIWGRAAHEVTGAFLPGAPAGGAGDIGSILCLLVLLFLSLVCPWFAEVLSGNAALRWICRLFAMGAYIALLRAPLHPAVRPVEKTDSFSGPSLVMPAFYLTIAGIFLLPGRKIPSLNYDASSSR